MGSHHRQAVEEYQDLTGHIQLVAQEKKFSEGGYSDLFKASWNDDSHTEELVAVKLLRLVGVDRRVDRRSDAQILEMRVRREARLWCALIHKNILPFYGICFGLENDDRPALVTPFYRAGNVEDYLRRHPETDRLIIISGIASGLKYLHVKDVVHGDLKPRNVLISDSGVPLLCDFGRSRVMDQKGFTTIVAGVSSRYLAPEVMTSEPPDDFPSQSETEPSWSALTPQSDIYSFGLTALEVWTDQVPFHRLKSDMHVIVHVGTGHTPRASHYNAVPKLLWDLCQECWDHKMVSRPTMDSVVERLADPAMIMHAGSSAS